MQDLADAGKMERKSSTLLGAVGYAILTVLLWLAGWLTSAGIFHQGLLVSIAALFVLGPLGSGFLLGVRITNAGFEAPWVFASAGMAVGWVITYLVATALLALCLLMWRGKSRATSAIAIPLAVLVWLAIGFANFVILGSGTSLPVR